MYNAFGLRVPDYSNNMVIEKDKLKIKIKKYWSSIDKVHCCYFD